ncbi:MAG: hypothetical protein QF903_06435 [Planctomycetota bacterium]|jgi:hypothetical protein|nr:hypothetical protein [Planctomycetota bacterium]MDP6762109.1 hypothetical protein [Planctomycetota bacterium]MDP6989098.1 hypothetical protein [Planctomycetota bacterium]
MRLLATCLCAGALAWEGTAPSPSAAAPATDGARAWLGRLSAPAAAERDRAQRWLAVHLRREDYAELARAAVEGDVELVRRLGDALAADGRHLALAVLLAVEEDASLAVLGSGVIAELVSAWCPRASERRAARGKVLGVLAGTGEHRFEIAPGPDAVPRLAGRLACLGELGAPLVVDPRLAGRAERALAGWTDTAAGLLAELAHADRLSLFGVGDWDGDAPGPGAFVLLAPRGAAREAGSDLLLAWCAAVQRGGPDAPSAARALAESGWPAALAWLERSWFERDDPAALDGLLSAAARGRIAPVLCSTEGRERLIAAADAGLRRGDDAGRLRAERIARALARAGSLSPLGEDLAPLLLVGWDRADEARTWVRLAALEGRSILADALAQQVAEVAEAPESPAPVRLAALRVLGGLTRPPRTLRIAGLARLWAWAGEQGARDEVAGLAAAVGGVDPDDSAAPAPLRFDALARAGRAAEAVALLLAGLADPDAASGRDDWVRVLSRRVEREGATSVARLLRPAQGAAGEEGDRASETLLMGLALQAGCLAPSREVRLFEQLAARAAAGAAFPPGDLLLLGELGAGPRGSSARKLLLARLEALDPAAGAEPADPAAAEALARALDAAARRLAEVRRDDLLLRFVGTVRRATVDPTHPLHGRLAAPSWPPPRLPRATLLSTLERRLP